jgi:hypothetical protein
VLTTAQRVRQAVTGVAAPEALKKDFAVSLREAVHWQAGVFAPNFPRVFLLPRVEPEELPAAVA